MNIEIHSPHGQVQEDLIKYVRNRLIEIHHRKYATAMARVYFRKEEGGDKACDIFLSSYGDPILIHRRAGNYKKAAHEMLKELLKQIDQQRKGQKEPQDLITSALEI